MTHFGMSMLWFWISYIYSLSSRNLSFGCKKCCSRKAKNGVELVLDLLHRYEFVEFNLGRTGDFDICAASSIKRATACGMDN